MPTFGHMVISDLNGAPRSLSDLLLIYFQSIESNSNHRKEEVLMLFLLLFFLADRLNFKQLAIVCVGLEVLGT